MLKYAPMRWKWFLLLTVLLSSLALSAPASAQDDMLGRINSLRASRGMPAYTINGALSVAAQQQAQWIVDNENVSHTHPDGSGPRTRALAAGYPSTMISENIYGGTMATANDAWTFWLNSPIHYNSLVSGNYQEIGIGSANSGRFAAYVLVFGGAGAPYIPPAAGGSSAGGSSANSPLAMPPPYLGGVDENGNIKHIVQPGDTLGDIALIYGYTWSDLGTLMQMNGLSDVRDLEVGSIFLVPSHTGTYTPTPDTRPPTETPVPTAVPPTITPFIASTRDTSGAIPTAAIAPPTEAAPVDSTPATPIPTTEATIAIATAGAGVLPPSMGTTPNPNIVEVAALPTPASEVRPLTAAIVPARNNTATWIMIALGVQVVVLVGAGVEYMRRSRRRVVRRKRN